MFGTRTVFEQDKYKVRRASSRDAPVVSALTKGDWSERVAISQRRRNDNPTQIADDLRAGGGLVLYRGSLPVAALSYVPARDGSWELRRLGVTRTFSGRGFTTLLVSTLENLARKAEVRSIRIPVDTYAPQYKAYFEKIGFSVEADRTFSTVFAAAMQPILMRKLVA
ncbi:MAG TPA: GNAT family N-acetyltransferase [Casimicrobium sp.]|jgi:N-acetylglutamate synthase-like GNAT family acetyltransferase|nr:GNAT family N-acetyltransferase [Casimicrobium sp.]